MRSYDSQTLEALDAGNVSLRNLAKFELDDGVHCFGNHTPGEVISIAGHSFYGVGGLASISDLTTSSGLAADQATIKVDGTMVMAPPPEYRDVASWFRDILKRDMLNRRCTIYELILQESTGAPLHASQEFAGPIDNTPLNVEAPELILRIRSNRQALTWSNGRSRSDADQRRVNALDGSLRHVGDVAARGGKMPWGIAPSRSGSRTGSGGGGRGSGGGFNRRIL